MGWVRPVRVLVFAQGDGARMAREAGADAVADDDETVKKIQDGWLDFDVAIATPDMMSTVGRLGRVLGPRGLMPNPKTGTVVPMEDLAGRSTRSRQVVLSSASTKLLTCMCRLVRLPLRKQHLLITLAALINAVRRNRPAASKGAYIRKIVLTTTMGPGIKSRSGFGPGYGNF